MRAQALLGCGFYLQWANRSYSKRAIEMLYYKVPVAPDDPADAAQRAMLPPHAADPNCPAQVANALLAYLKRRLGADDIRYLRSPVSNPNGWGTHTYGFRPAATHRG